VAWDDPGMPNPANTAVAVIVLTPVARLVLTYIRGRVARGEIKHNTAARQRSILMGFADSYGRRPVNLLGRKHIEQWMEQRQDLSPASRRNEFQAVRQFTRWLMVEKQIKTDPCATMRAPKVPRSVPRAMPHDDVQRLLGALPDNRARLVTALMLNMGLRRGEVLSLQAGDYDTHARTITVVGKGGHARLLPVPDEVAHHMRAYMTERGNVAGPLVLREDGRGGISDSRLGQLVRSWMEDAGVKVRAGDGRAAHSLRHTLATNVVAVEPDLRVVQQILGHVSLTSTQIYLAAADLPRVRSAMERAS
jgi:site-specific recombinase XerD